MNEYWMWWKDGSKQELLVGDDELAAAAKRFDFDFDRVKRDGAVDFLDDGGTAYFDEGIDSSEDRVVGGIYLDVTR